MLYRIQDDVLTVVVVHAGHVATHSRNTCRERSEGALGVTKNQWFLDAQAVLS